MLHLEARRRSSRLGTPGYSRKDEACSEYFKMLQNTVDNLYKKLLMCCWRVYLIVLVVTLIDFAETLPFKPPSTCTTDRPPTFQARRACRFLCPQSRMTLPQGAPAATTSTVPQLRRMHDAVHSIPRRKDIGLHRLVDRPEPGTLSFSRVRDRLVAGHHRQHLWPGIGPVRRGCRQGQRDPAQSGDQGPAQVGQQ